MMAQERKASEAHWAGSYPAWRDQFLSWLVTDQWSQGQVLRWMGGEELPAEDVRTEPHLQLLRALEGWPRQKYGPVLAERVASVLRERPDQLSDESRDRLLYNLLYLCSGLNRSRELCGALDGFLMQADLAGRSYNDVPLTTALRAALVWNQNDSRWFTYWRRMIELAADPKVPGLPADGFDAILIGWPGDPVAEIGWALAEMGKLIDRNLQSHQERERRFIQLLDRSESRQRGMALKRPELLTEVLAGACPAWALPLFPAVRNRVMSLRPKAQVQIIETTIQSLHKSGYSSGGAFMDFLRYHQLWTVGESLAGLQQSL